MRKAISIVLAGLLVLLPVEQVLAQAVQQEAVSVQRSVSPDGAAHLFRVPPLTETTARLLRTSSDLPHMDSPFAEPSSSDADAVAGWDDWSNRHRGLAALALVVALVITFIVLLNKENVPFDDGS